MLVVLVSTSDPGLEIFATHRVFTGRPDIDLGRRAVPDGRGGARRARRRAARTRRPPSSCGPLEARLVHGAPGELDVELVDRFGHDGISYTPDRDEAVRRVESGEADCAFAPAADADRGRLRRGRAAASRCRQKTTYFFPKLALRAALPPGRPVTDWLAFSRACVADLDGGPRRPADARSSASPCFAPARAATTRRRSTPRPRTRSSAGSRRSAST